MSSALVSIVVAFLGFSLHNISQAGQKIGLSRYRKKGKSGGFIWALATVGTSVAFVLILAAISLGSVSMVGAMAGTGLVSLALFSHFVMKENLARRELLSLAAVVAGGVLVGAFASRSPAAVGDSEARIPLLWGILAGGSALYVIVWLLTRRLRFTGAVVGGFSGFLGAYSQLFQEYGTTAQPISLGIGPFFSAILSNPITLVWIGLSVVSMLVLQFSYRHGRAIEIIPSFVGNFIVVPVTGGVLIFGQLLLPVQWIGVALIVTGSVALGRGQVEIAAVSRRVAESHGDNREPRR